MLFLLFWFVFLLSFVVFQVWSCVLKCLLQKIVYLLTCALCLAFCLSTGICEASQQAYCNRILEGKGHKLMVCLQSRYFEKPEALWKLILSEEEWRALLHLLYKFQEDGAPLTCLCDSSIGTEVGILGTVTACQLVSAFICIATAAHKYPLSHNVSRELCGSVFTYSLHLLRLFILS